MALLLERYTRASFDGTSHYNANSTPTDAAVIPPSPIVNAVGKRPATSIHFDWDGLNAYPTAGPGAYPHNSNRCEIGIGGGLSYVEGGVYWADYYERLITCPTVTSEDPWNYGSQFRSEAGATPSPCPAIAYIASNVCIRRNFSDGYQPPGGKVDILTPIALATWVHFTVGWKWSTSATVGWIKASVNGTVVRTQKTCRTALDSSSGAQWRFGYYRDVSTFLGDPAEKYLWGLTIHDSEPTTTPEPDPGGGSGTLAEDAARFGADYSGVSVWAATGDRSRGTAYPLQSPAEIPGIKCFLDGLGGTTSQTARCLIYNAATNALVAATDAVLVTAGVTGDWVLFPFSGTLPLLASGSYRLHLQTRTDGNCIRYYYADAAAGSLEWNYATWGTAANPWTTSGGGTDAKALGIYALTQTPAPPPAGNIPMAFAASSDSIVEIAAGLDDPSGITVPTQYLGSETIAQHQYDVKRVYDKRTGRTLVWSAGLGGYIEAP